MIATYPLPVTPGRYIAVGKHLVSHGKYWPIKGLYCSRNPELARGFLRCQETRLRLIRVVPAGLPFS